MFIELQSTHFNKARHLFTGHKQYIPVLSVLEGNFPGRVFADSHEGPTVALVWARGRWAYIEGDLSARGLVDSIRGLVADVITPDSLSMNMNWFELYAPNSNGWGSALQQSLHPSKGEKHMESVFTWDKSAYREFRSRYLRPSAITLELSQIPILSAGIQNSRIIPEKFHAATAIGCEAKANNDAVALCRSNGFAAGDEFMIDVATYATKDRRRGYATAATVGLLDYCLEHGLEPLWETTEDNLASRRLAQKVGFADAESYPVYAIRF